MSSISRIAAIRGHSSKNETNGFDHIVAREFSVAFVETFKKFINDLGRVPHDDIVILQRFPQSFIVTDSVTKHGFRYTQFRDPDTSYIALYFKSLVFEKLVTIKGWAQTVDYLLECIDLKLTITEDSVIVQKYQYEERLNSNMASDTNLPQSAIVPEVPQIVSDLSSPAPMIVQQLGGVPGIMGQIAGDHQNFASIVGNTWFTLGNNLQINTGTTEGTLLFSYNYNNVWNKWMIEWFKYHQLYSGSIGVKMRVVGAATYIGELMVGFYYGDKDDDKVTLDDLLMYKPSLIGVSQYQEVEFQFHPVHESRYYFDATNIPNKNVRLMGFVKVPLNNAYPTDTIEVKIELFSKPLTWTCWRPRMVTQPTPKPETLTWFDGKSLDEIFNTFKVKAPNDPVRLVLDSATYEACNTSENTAVYDPIPSDALDPYRLGGYHMYYTSENEPNTPGSYTFRPLVSGSELLGYYWYLPMMVLMGVIPTDMLSEIKDWYMGWHSRITQTPEFAKNYPASETSPLFVKVVKSIPPWDELIILLTKYNVKIWRDQRVAKGGHSNYNDSGRETFGQYKMRSRDNLVLMFEVNNRIGAIICRSDCTEVVKGKDDNLNIWLNLGSAFEDKQTAPVAYLRYLPIDEDDLWLRTKESGTVKTMSSDYRTIKFTSSDIFSNNSTLLSNTAYVKNTLLENSLANMLTLLTEKPFVDFALVDETTGDAPMNIRFIRDTRLFILRMDSLFGVTTNISNFVIKNIQAVDKGVKLNPSRMYFRSLQTLNVDTLQGNAMGAVAGVGSAVGGLAGGIGNWAMEQQKLDWNKEQWGQILEQNKELLGQTQQHQTNMQQNTINAQKDLQQTGINAQVGMQDSQHMHEIALENTRFSNALTLAGGKANVSAQVWTPGGTVQAMLGRRVNPETQSISIPPPTGVSYATPKKDTLKEGQDSLSASSTNEHVLSNAPTSTRNDTLDFSNPGSITV